MTKILITGANGQIGSELIVALRAKFGKANVVGLDLRAPKEGEGNGPTEIIDVTDKTGLDKVIAKHKIDTIYHLVGILSAAGEKDPELAWRVNVDSLKNVLDIARTRGLRVFWPSSIAAFGPTTPRMNTPQETVMEPNTMYGVTKVAGELLCQYYFLKYDVDVRSLRYPGLISWKTPPGGGTTDYACAIFYDALQKGEYQFFVRPDTMLPMMYMPDAIRATMELMETPAESLSVRTSYNLAAVSFSARQIADAVKRRRPDFTYSFQPDFRQQIADSWPRSVDDSAARRDWGWSHQYGLDRICDDMLGNLKKTLKPIKK